MGFSNLKVNHRTEPLGCPVEGLLFSWNYTGKTQGPVYYRLQIARDPYFEFLVLDSGWDELNPLGYSPDLTCYPRCRYYWRVMATNGGSEPEISRKSWFETDKHKEFWQAKWICAPFSEHPIFRTTFEATKGMDARAYICGLGLYEIYLNGTRVGDEYLLPGYHSYDLRLMYQTIELDHYLKTGQNELEILLAPGWYMGRFCFNPQENIYGDQMTVLCELHLEDEVVGTDTSWECRKSPFLFSNIYDGEVYDANVKPSFDCWQKAVLLAPDKAKDLSDRLVSRTNNKIREIERIKPVQIITTPSGDTVLDFGQNLAGWFAFDADVPAGEKITIQAAEVLIHGEVFRENLRTAKAEYVYISDGTKQRVSQHFTFYGFRYLKVEGIADVEAANFEAIVLSSVGERTGYLETGNPLVNRLYENSRWGQLGNFIDVPTDCPQRDERMGWTGDTQIYSATACYNYDCTSFYAKFMEDVLLEQGLLNGSVPYVVPDPKIKMGDFTEELRSHGSCAWADVATIVPWNVYKFYGDKQLLAREYPSMTGWSDYIQSQETPDHLWQSGFHFADWLALDNPNPGPLGGTDSHYCASAYYFYSVSLTAAAAKELGYFEDYKKYSNLAKQIRQSFLKTYFNAQGLPTENTQTAAVVALAFGLCPYGGEQIVADHLHELLQSKDMHLDTGFIGTGYLMNVLSEYGYHEDAVTLLLQEDYPSWLYPVKMGATTIWERWNSILPDGTMNPDGMNSLNHYAYGSVCEWMYRNLGGLAPMRPGFTEALFEPKADRRLGYVQAEYRSASGTYKYGWDADERKTTYYLTVPFGCSALIRIPGIKEETVGAGEWTFSVNK